MSGQTAQRGKIFLELRFSCAFLPSISDSEMTEQPR